MIKFDKMWLEGFGSIVPRTKFKLNRPGLNVIIGENGAGKTTFISGLSWVLFGVSFKRSVATWPIIRPNGFVGTYGEVKWTKGKDTYRIIRTQDYKGKDGPKGSKLILEINGVSSDIRDKKPLQAEIVRVLGYSHSLFINTIIFGQKLKRIIEETGPNKKKVFEEAFEASFVGEGRARAEADLKHKRLEFKEMEEAFTKYENEKALIKTKIEVIEKEKEKFEIEKGKEINYIQSNITKVSKAIKEYKPEPVKDYRDKVKALDKKIASVNKDRIKEAEDAVFRQEHLILTYGSNAGKLENQIKAKTNSFTDLTKKCPRCGSKLKPSAIKVEKEKIKGEISELKKEIKSWEKKVSKEEIVLSELKDKVSSLNKDKDKLNSFEKTKKSYEAKIKVAQVGENRYNLNKENLKDWQKDLQREKAKVFKDEIPKYKAELKALKKGNADIRKHFKVVKKEIKNLEWVINDALGNKGLKAYIFDTMLRGLNENLKYYYQYTGFRAEFGVDLDSGNKDIYTVIYVEVDGKEEMVYFEDLSGGEQQKVNICTAFAMYDLVSGDRKVNLIQFDEIFDGLTEANTDLIYELIQDKGRDKCVYLITHNLQLQNSSDKVIRVSKNQQGHTQLKML